MGLSTRYSMSIILKHLTKRYGNQIIVDDLSLEIRDGEFFVLLGASGSGKSTILRMIAGLSTPERGQIWLGGNDVTQWVPQKRRIGFVFQNYSIFAHLNVAQNIEFGMKIRKMSTTERARRLAQLLDLVGLSGFGSRYTNQLSGGQQQRVALARALAYQPKVLLLDEPFGALDGKTRTQLRRSLKAIQHRLRITTILVTHDQEEAFELADRIGVIEHGKLLEVGVAEDLYGQPKTLFGATFLGNGTVLIGKVKGGTACFGPVRLPIPSTVPHTEGASIQLLFRPEHVILTPEKPDNDNPLIGRGEIREASFAAATRRVRISLPPLSETRQISPPLPSGEPGLLFDALLPTDSKLPESNPWVSLKGWHILEQPPARLLVYDDGRGPTTALKMASQFVERLNASATLLGVSQGSEAGDEFVSRLTKRRNKAGFSHADLRFRYGNPVHQITREQMETLYEMLILTVKPRLFGSLDPRPKKIGPILIRTLKNANLPVLVINGRHRQMERMVIYLEDGERDPIDVLVGGRLAQRLGLSVTLLHVASAGDKPTPETESHLNQELTALKVLGITCEWRFRQASTPMQGIFAELRAGHGEIIVIGQHKPESSTLIAPDSLVLQVLARVDRPVLIVPEKGA
jgi:sulfate transport system ATP-binding protein